MRGWLEVFGGIGLFLMGMTLMTEGLRVVAGDTIRRGLERFTKGTVSGAIAGAVATGLFQSSSAVTLLAVGFVGAGLMTSQQSLGIILGANVGTTVTGWMVAILGVKLNLGLFALPVLFVGALIRLFGREQTKALGQTLAGFGMLFLGISILQSGMEQFRHIASPDSFPPNTWWGRSQLFFTGIVITLITQSSSAGISTVVTALHGGYLSLGQAAALAVGMDVGTTATAMMATVGGNVNARRTGATHVVFNVLTGIVAFLAIPLYVHFWELWNGVSKGEGAELGLVTFHSLLNFVGVLCLLPFANRFSDFINWLVPAGNSELERRLEPSLLSHPRLAFENVQATLKDIVDVVFAELVTLLRSRESPSVFRKVMEQAEQATLQTSRYLENIRTQVPDSSLNRRKTASYHVVDHLRRLLVRAAKEDRLRTVLHDPTLTELSEKLWRSVEATSRTGFTCEAAQTIEAVWVELDKLAEPYRQQTIEFAIREGTSSKETLDRLDGIRWLRRLAYHTWRITYHLANFSIGAESKNSSPLLQQESDPIDE